ncbi:Wzz/FepE/Etk N-terminal domain-containing protein [Saccharicrinis fermentans]|uniref:Ferric enterobactin transport protein FepE n=1 Tax=Saccharicrinis fermentans DSM 9555 = JCM 21142 TaxID=869213 RepID=W7Y239_9BACT|nr:Wzz/FepE/Etk N-terminal domain-containing protein [Saccharicrinis fermentans]GAF02027.1 ferric enterobactin transport protein FepE [Saccharicrinis fermentans DSM 9555 = JCM 21142]
MTNQDSKEEKKHQIIKDDEIDLIALIKTIWDGRKTIYYSVAVCVFIGLLIAFLSPAKYTASATLLPSSNKQGSNLGGLSALAGMAGVNLNSMMGQSEGIPPEIYPEIVNSYPFLNEFIHEKFHFEKYAEPISIYDYVMADTIPSIGAKIAQYTIRLPWTMKDAFSSGKEEDERFNSVDYGVLNLTEEKQNALSVVFQLFEIDVDAKTGLVRISMEEREPILVTQYVQKCIELLQKYIINYKTQQVRENLDFVQARFDEKKAAYEEAQRNYFNYKDSHRNAVSERVDMEFQRLSDAYDMASTVYKSLAQQLEQAKIAVKEETPVFTILEPAKVPMEKSAPNKKLILIVSVFLGGFIGLGIILGKIVWGNLITNFD